MGEENFNISRVKIYIEFESKTLEFDCTKLDCSKLSIDL